ncbi:MAG TPA: hypothetical protein VNL91_05060 [Thermoanaerobaculia bacterium]|nr:hypothetical protein [Thermoanaerobaculia bacterium]
MSIDVSELRVSERYLAIEPLLGSFGVASVSILDIAEQGVQVEHAQPLRIATKGRLWFKKDDIVVSVPGIVIWSHLSKNANEKGKLLYHSGIRVDDPSAAFAGAVEALVVRGVIRADPKSLDRKRLRLLKKQHERFGTRGRVLRHDEAIGSEQAVLIQHARTLLEANPEEARRWTQRAKYALTQSAGSAAADIDQHADEALAVWEYLDRMVDLGTITRFLNDGK